MTRTMNRTAALLMGAALTLPLLLSPASSQADAPKHKGQWEITTTIKMPPGVPFQPPPHTATQCVDEKTPVPQPPKQQGSCEIESVKVDDPKVSWVVKCKGPRAAEGVGEITYGADTMSGTVKLKMKSPRDGATMEVLQTLAGKRLGDCK